MKAKHVGKKNAGKVKGGLASRHGKAGLQKHADRSGATPDDRRIHEIERTFTLSYEW